MNANAPPRDGAEGPITDPREVGPALQRAIGVIKNEGRPALLDTVTQFR